MPLVQNPYGYLCVFKWSLKTCALEDAKSHWLHLLDFSPLWVFKCLPKIPFWEDAYLHSHTGFICLTFLHCVFSNASSNVLPERRHKPISCIYLTFLHCVFSNVSAKQCHRQLQSRIGCIFFTFLHCGVHNVFSNVSSNCLPQKKHNCIGCICLAFLHCVFSYGSRKSPAWEDA